MSGRFSGSFLGGVAEGLRSERQIANQTAAVKIGQDRLGLDKQRFSAQEKKAEQEQISKLKNGINAAFLAMAQAADQQVGEERSNAFEAAKRVAAIGIASLASSENPQAQALAIKFQQDLASGKFPGRGLQTAQAQGKRAAAGEVAQAKATINVPGTKTFLNNESLKLKRTVAAAQLSAARAREATAKSKAAGKPNIKETLALRRDFLRSSANYIGALGGFRKLEAASRLDTGAGDIALIFGFMKVLDPRSTVRENEAATVENAGGVSARFRNLYNKALKGVRLRPEIRQQIVGAAGSQFQALQKIHDERIKSFKSLAERNGFDPRDILVDLAQVASGAQAPTSGARTGGITGGGGTFAGAPSAGAINHLRANPDLAAEFDKKFGQGAAARALGQ